MKSFFVGLFLIIIGMAFFGLIGFLIGLFKNRFKIVEKEAQEDRKQSQQNERDSSLDNKMTGSLVALYKKTHEEKYKIEYLRRLVHIGFSDEQAIVLFLYEISIIKHLKIDMLADENYIINNYFDLKNLALQMDNKEYIDHQFFLCSEIVKIWDEAEWHFINSHETISDDKIWAEIYSISRYGGGELFVEYLTSMAEKSSIPIELIRKYSVAEQDMLFKYKWNPDKNEKHPYLNDTEPSDYDGKMYGNNI